MPNTKRAAIYCSDQDEKTSAEKQAKIYEYAQAQGYVLTQHFTSPEEILQSTEEFDILLSAGEPVPLPLAGIEFVTL